jgi:hypothetical protein
MLRMSTRNRRTGQTTVTERAPIAVRFSCATRRLLNWEMGPSGFARLQHIFLRGAVRTIRSPGSQLLTRNRGDYCRYRTTSRVASSTSAPIASSERNSEWCKTAVCVSASIDVTHTNAASPRSTARNSSLWASR